MRCGVDAFSVGVESGGVAEGGQSGVLGGGESGAGAEQGRESEAMEGGFGEGGGRTVRGLGSGRESH